MQCSRAGERRARSSTFSGRWALSRSSDRTSRRVLRVRKKPRPPVATAAGAAPQRAGDDESRLVGPAVAGAGWSGSSSLTTPTGGVDRQAPGRPRTGRRAGARRGSPPPLVGDAARPLSSGRLVGAVEGGVLERARIVDRLDVREDARRERPARRRGRAGWPAGRRSGDWGSRRCRGGAARRAGRRRRTRRTGRRDRWPAASGLSQSAVSRIWRGAASAGAA